VQRHLDRVRAHPEVLADLPGGEIGAVAERDQLTIVPAESLDHPREVDAERYVALGSGLLRQLVDRRQATGRDVVHGAPRNPDQPGGGRPFSRVIARAVANRTLEDVGRRVLRVGPLTQSVGAVGIDALDQRLGIGERVSPQERFASRSPPPFSSLGNLGVDSGTREEDTNLPAELASSRIPHLSDPNSVGIAQCLRELRSAKRFCSYPMDFPRGVPHPPGG
jgi:hypothetical protein